LQVNRNENYIEFIGDFTVLSSAPLNGGLTEAKRIINHKTDPGEKGPIRDYFRKKFLSRGEGLEGLVGFLTAVDVTTGFVGCEDWEGNSLKIMVTAGVGDPVDPRYHNTINVIVFTELNLTTAGMANLFIVATEAKVAALREMEIIKNGKEITGTPTDAIAIAKPRSPSVPGPEVNFTGTATETGHRVYELVKKGVLASLEKNNGYSTDRNILDRLAERGISRERLVETAFSLLAGEPEDEGELEEEFLDTLRTYSCDPNIHFLLASSFYLESEKKRLKLKGDPGRLVADELIGIEIAEYIGGKNALFNFIRYDREKPEILSELPPFLDDAVGGLLAGVMTKTFELHN